MASYNPPNPYVPGAFNPSQFITPSDNITTKFLDENYLRFPFAQGVENFVSINNQGSLNQGGLADFTSNTTPAVFNLPPTITNPILDSATTPTNAVATIGYVLANESGGSDLLPLNNLWTGVNNFNPPVQTYGSTMPQGLTLTNNQNSSTPAGDNDIISYTPSSTQGLCIYSSSTSSVAGKTAQIVLQPDGVKTSLFANGTQGVVQLNALGGTQSKVIIQASSGLYLQLTPTINFNDLGTLTADSSGLSSSINITAPSLTTQLITQTANNTDITVLGSGLNSSIILDATAGVILKTNPTISFGTFGTLTATGVTSGIKSSANFTSPSFIISDGVDDNYQLYSQNSGSFGFVIANTSGTGLGTLTISNGSSIATTLSSTTSGLTISSATLLPAQTDYTPSFTYGNYAATQQFVQLALASQGSGDVTLAGNNDFTGINNFNNNNNGFNDATFSDTGLTICGNTQVGAGEADIICISNYPQSNVALNIYGELYSVTKTTVPKIQVYNDGTATLFNTNITLPAQSTYNPGATYGNLAATQAFVQSAESGIFTATSSISIQNFGGSQVGFPTPTGATFTQTYNSKTQTNTWYMTPFVFTAASSVIQFTLVFATELYPAGSTPIFLAGSGLTYYNASFGQTFSFSTSFLSNTQIRCTTSPTQSIGGTSQVSGQILIGWTY